MKKHIFSTLLAGTVAVLALGTTNLMAQRGQGGGFGGGNFDPAEMQAMMREQTMTTYQTTLGFSDDEWGAIAPIVEKVYDAQQAVTEANAGAGRGGRGGRGGQGGGRGGRGGFGADPLPELVALQEALQDENTSADEIREKLAALRKVRTTREEALTKARATLKELLTVRQEAAAVTIGLLE